MLTVNNKGGQQLIINNFKYNIKRKTKTRLFGAVQIQTVQQKQKQT
jgi:hypothetical protein